MDTPKPIESGETRYEDSKVEKIFQLICEQLKAYEVEPDDLDWDDEKTTVSFRLHPANEPFTFTRSEFLELPEEIKTMRIAKDVTAVRTSKRTLRIVKATSNETAAVVHEGLTKKLGMKTADGIEIGIKTGSFFVAVAAFQREAYDSDFFPPDYYNCVEIEWGGTSRKTEEEEERIVDTYLFELAASTGLVFQKDALLIERPWDDGFVDAEEDDFPPKCRPLEQFNEGMRLYLAGVQVDDPELKLLSLFKVFEFFAPIVWALDSNEALRKKLDSPSALNPDANFLQSIFELARSLDKRRNDNEMIRLVFETSLDFVELSTLLPQPRFKKFNYGDKKADIDGQCRNAAEVLVATRNQVAHAKSDYKPLGIELKPDEFGPFNAFLEAAAVQAVRWYNRLPSHLKLTF